MSITYNEQIGKKINVSEHDFDRISKEIYDELVHKYADPEDLDISLYIP